MKDATSDNKVAEKKTPEPVKIIKGTQADTADEKPVAKHRLRETQEQVVETDASDLCQGSRDAQFQMLF